MTTKTILEHTNLGTAPASADKFAVVDVSDTTDAASGTTKKVTAANVLDQYLANITSENLTDFSDVAITAPSSGEGLIYNSGSGDFENAAFSVGVGEVDFVASGTIAQGDIVRVNNDGTVSVIASESAGFGSIVTFESAGVESCAATYDSTNNAVVLVYVDGGNSDYGTAIVGTVSGSSISFGTAVVFASADIDHVSAAFDSTNGKVVAAYRDVTPAKGNAIVGTVSGTSISFGTAVEFEANSATNSCLVFDETNSKMVISYRDFSSTHGNARVGTVSGTSISFGTEATFEAAGVNEVTGTYDSANGKIVYSYIDSGNASYGTAIVGTVSGTSISFGTAAVFESANTSNIGMAFDSIQDKVVVTYSDNGNSSHGTAIVGTVSGTSISFGTAAVFNSAQTTSTAAAFDVAKGEIGICYRDAGNSSYGTTVVGTVSGTSISFGAEVVFASTFAVPFDTPPYDPVNEKIVLSYKDNTDSSYGKSIVWQTSDGSSGSIKNIAGVATAAISDTATGTIKVSGGTSAEFAGLTIGSEYFVTDAGAATTTDTGRPLGRAISATEILLRTV